MEDVDEGARVLVERGAQRLLLARLPTDGCPLSLVDDLARLRLALARFGWAVRIDGAADDFRELVELCGLAEVFDP